MRWKIWTLVLACTSIGASAQSAPQPQRELLRSSVVEKKIMETLREMYEAEKRKDLDFIFSHLSDDFAEVAGDGRVYRRADIAAEFKNVTLKNYSLSDCAFNLMTPDSAYQTCLMQVDAEYKGQPFPANMRVSWIWTLVDKDWKLRFEQATLIPPAKTDSTK